MRNLAIAAGLNKITHSINLITLAAKVRELRHMKEKQCKKGAEACWNYKIKEKEKTKEVVK